MILRIIAAKNGKSKELDLDTATTPIPREGDYLWVDSEQRYKVFVVEHDYPNNMVRVFTYALSN